MNEPVERRGPGDPGASSSRKRARASSDPPPPAWGSSSAHPLGMGAVSSTISSFLAAGPSSLHNTIQAFSPGQPGSTSSSQWSYLIPGTLAPPPALPPSPYVLPPPYGPPPPYAPPPMSMAPPPPPQLAPSGSIQLSIRGPGLFQAFAGPGSVQDSSSSQAFVGWPTSVDIIGSLSTWPLGTTLPPCGSCSAPGHASWECPARYAQVLGYVCPGFTTTGTRDPDAWVAGELTAAARQAWIDFGARFRLTVARWAPPGAPAF